MITGECTYTAYLTHGYTGLPKYCVRRRDAIELRVGGVRVLDISITDCGTVDHYHHCSIRWRSRGSEFHSSAGDVCVSDTGLAVRIKEKILR